MYLKREVDMAITTMVHIRVDEQIKTQAAETLATMGLTVSVNWGQSKIKHCANIKDSLNCLLVNKRYNN